MKKQHIKNILITIGVILAIAFCPKVVLSLIGIVVVITSVNLIASIKTLFSPMGLLVLGGVLLPIVAYTI